MKAGEPKDTLNISHVERLAPGFFEASGYIRETGVRVGNSSTIGRTKRQAAYKLWEYANQMHGPIEYPREQINQY